MKGYTAETNNVRPTLSTKTVFTVTEYMYHRILFVVEQWVFLCFLLDCHIWIACQNPRCEIRMGLREIRTLRRMVLPFDSDSPLPILQMVNVHCNIETRINSNKRWIRQDRPSWQLWRSYTMGHGPWRQNSHLAQHEFHPGVSCHRSQRSVYSRGWNVGTSWLYTMASSIFF